MRGVLRPIMSHSRCSWLMCRRFLLPKNTKTFSDAESGHDSSASTTWKILLGLIEKIRGSLEHILKPYLHNICVLFFTTNMTCEILCVSYSHQVPYCRNFNYVTGQVCRLKFGQALHCWELLYSLEFVKNSLKPLLCPDSKSCV
ncbi:hypothetical protein M758_8G153600 [Ceratodon purpureus]|nr:hypothetical protein M758_8G153600 [Ceratodon purpureus]